MKRIYRLKYLILVICVLISDGCDVERSSHSKALSAIDSVADVSPRRALAMLDSIGPKINAADKADRNYYDLLRIKTEDKLYVAHTTDTLMLRLLDYYENEGDKRLLPMAYYYAGRVYYDMNDDMRALPYFQKTVEMADTIDNLRSKAYSQIGYIFLYQGIYDKGINAFNEAYKLDLKSGDLKGQVFNLCGIAYCLQREDKEEQTTAYFKKALMLSYKANDKLLEADVLGQLANHYYNIEEYTVAQNYITKALNSVVDKPNAKAIYFIAADIYEKVGKKDSSILFYEKLYSVDDVYAKQASSKWLGHYYLHHDLSKATYYLQQYEKYSDSIQTIKQTEGVARIDAIYNYNKTEIENMVLKQRLIKNKFIICVVCIIICFAFIILASYLKKKRLIEKIRFENEAKYLKEKYKQSQAFIEENNSQIVKLNLIIDEIVNKNDKLVSELKMKEEQLKNMNKIAGIMAVNRKLAKSGLENSEACRKIWSMVNDKTINDEKKKITKECWENLDRDVNENFKGFREKLIEICKINEYEYHVCLLLKIELKPIYIALLTNRERNTISSIRKRLYKRAFGKDVEPKKWDEFIRSL